MRICLDTKGEVGGDAPATRRTTGGPPVGNEMPVIFPPGFLYEFPQAMSTAEGHFYTPIRERSIHHRNLPHWATDSTLVFVTYRLDDALPSHLLAKWHDERDEWIHLHPPPWTDAVTREYYEIFPEKLNVMLDAGHGSCVLARENIRAIVTENLLHFNGERYLLHSFVVMPNHVHILFEIGDRNDLAKIVWKWKSYTAKRINAAIGCDGVLWRKEYYDRLIRNAAHNRKVVEYIRKNARAAEALLASGKISLQGDAPAARRTTGGPPVGSGGAESDAPATLQGGVEYCATVGKLSSAEGSQGGGT